MMIQRDKNGVMMERGDRYYVLCDTSTIKIRNMFIVRGIFLKRNNRTNAGAAAMLMKDLGELPEEEFTTEVSDQMVFALQEVESALEEQIMPPTVLAHRKASGRNKAYNYAHTFRLESK